MTRQVPHLIQERLLLNNILQRNDDNIQTDVMDSHCTVQRNPNINSMTGNRFETSAKGEIPRLEIYESHKALVDAADNWADAGTTRSSAGEGLQSSYGVGILDFKL